MLGKKLLSLIGFLFLGSQIAYAVEISGCEPDEIKGSDECVVSARRKRDGENNIYSYCISGKKLYAKSGDEGSTYCKISGDLSSEFNIIKLDGVSKADANLSEEIGETITKYAIFACDDNSCSQTVGIIKANDKYYKIYNDQDQNVEITINESATCSNNVGGLISGNKLCLNERGNTITMGSSSTDRYLMEGKTQASVPFVLPNGKTGIVIAVGGNYIVHDTKYNNEFYNDYSTNKLINRKYNFCSGSYLNTLQDCEAGICEEEPNKYEEGTYLVDGKIYSCNPKVSETTCSCLTPKNDVSGLKAFIINNPQDRTYATVFDSYTINNDDADVLENDILENDIKMYNCEEGECTVINGLMIYNDEKIAKCEPDKSDNNKYKCANSLIVTKCESENEVGGVEIDDKKLCVEDGESYKLIGGVDKEDKEYYAPVDSKYVKYLFSDNLIGEVAAEPGYYLIDGNYQRITSAVETTGNAGSYRKKRNGDNTGNSVTPTTNTEIPTNVMIKCAQGEGDVVTCAKLDTIAAGYYYNAGGTNIIQCTSNEASSCTLVEVPMGYYKSVESNNPVIACDKNKYCEKVVDLQDCNAENVGILTSDEKLCLTNGKQSSTFGTTGYYLADNFLGYSVENRKYIVKVDTNSITIDEDQTLVRIDGDLSVTNDSNCTNFYTCNRGICKKGSETQCDVSNGKECDNGYYLVSENNGKTLITDTTTSGYLYKCLGDEGSVSCELIKEKGYKFVKSKIYSNDGNENGSKNVTPVESTAEGACTNNGIETLFYDTGDNEQLKICLGIGISAEINISAENNNVGRYIIGRNEENKVNESDVSSYIFVGKNDENTHALITISNTEIKLDKDYKSPVKYVYTDTPSSRVLIRGEENYSCSENGISEYKCNDALCTFKETPVSTEVPMDG